MTIPIREISLFAGTLPVQVSDTGTGPAFVLLHGGAGPASMAGLIAPLAAAGRVVAPTLPGVQGTMRPDWFASVSDLALMVLALIEKLGLSEVILIGNSIGGWIAAETALRGAAMVKGAVLLNPAGIAPDPGQPAITNPLSHPPRERLRLAFHDPVRFAPPPTPEALAMLQANQPTLLAYAGQPFMHDPHLKPRLAAMKVPVQVLWGTSDRIVTLPYGQSFAAAIPTAEFVPIEAAGHFPQIEQPDAVLAAITAFAAKAR